MMLIKFQYVGSDVIANEKGELFLLAKVQMQPMDIVEYNIFLENLSGELTFTLKTLDHPEVVK